MIFFLLPAYNEEPNISAIIKEIKHFFKPEEHQIILINDGSTDKTAQIARDTDSKIKIISHQINKGLGTALKTGFDYILGIIAKNDVLITLDADNTHPIELSKALIESVKTNNSDIVIASRYCGSGKEIGLKYYRRIYSFLAGLIFSIFFKYPGLKDYTCGYRAYKGSFLIKLREKYGKNFITETGFPAGTEILLKSLQLKPFVTEIPLILRYDLKRGKSKMKVLKTILSYLKLIFKTKLIN